MEKINYKLEVFEGPMDLLLSLITKHQNCQQGTHHPLFLDYLFQIEPEHEECKSYEKQRTPSIAD